MFAYMAYSFRLNVQDDNDLTFICCLLFLFRNTPYAMHFHTAFVRVGFPFEVSKVMAW